MTHKDYYLSILEEIGEPSLDLVSSRARKNIEKEIWKVKKELEKELDIKVPLVGCFNAGKSSLLNAYLGQDTFLPIDIVPKTAVATELHYAETETYKIIRDEVDVVSGPLDRVDNIVTKPGDILHLYINNEKIKQLQKKNITLVDMPGLDSGLEEHNRSIMSYFRMGVSFVLIIEAEMGSIPETVLNFMQEIKSYNISSTVLISKIDLKPESEVLKIKEHIKTQTKQAIGKDIRPGCTSAILNKYDDFENFLNTLDSEELYKKYHKSTLLKFINDLKNELGIELSVSTQNIDELSRKLEILKNQKQETLEKLDKHIFYVNSGTFIADNVTEEIKEKLFIRERYFVNLLMKNRKQLFINDLLVVTRPVIVRKMQVEYERIVKEIAIVRHDFDKALDDFQTNLRDSLEEAYKPGNQFFARIDKLLGDFQQKNFGKLIQVIIFVISPLVQVFISLITEILEFFGIGVSHETRYRKMADKFSFEIVPAICEKLSPEVTKFFKEQQTYLVEESKKLIQEEVDKRVVRIEEQKQQTEVKANEIQEKSTQIVEIITKIEKYFNKLY